MGAGVEPLDPKSVGSVVRYGLAADALVHEAAGESLVYSQLYPFAGLQNYTSGIIHHVRLQGHPPPPSPKFSTKITNFYQYHQTEFHLSPLPICHAHIVQASSRGRSTTTGAATRPSPAA